MKTRTNLFLNIFLFIFWWIFAGIWFFLFIPNLYLILDWNLVVWEIVDIDKSSDTDWKTTYAPVVEYNCAGKNIRKQSYLHSSNYPEVWEKIEIYCLSSNPESFVINSFMDKYFGLFFLFSWLIVFLIPIGTYIHRVNRSKFISNIKSNWNILNLKVDFVGKNESYKVNWQSPYFIQAQYLDNVTNKIHVFKSDYIWYNIEEYVKVWDNIKVYVYMNNYKKYWVDTDFLPNLS